MGARPVRQSSRQVEGPRTLRCSIPIEDASRQKNSPPGFNTRHVARNGYLKSLKEVVHFYNTRDALPVCKPGDRGEKVTCWPAPENPETMNRRQLGNLKLSDKQEDFLVAFLKTLTDGYSATGK